MIMKQLVYFEMYDNLHSKDSDYFVIKPPLTVSFSFAK